MLELDLDLNQYISRRKGLVEQRARDGSAYGFSGERKVRRALVSARPVVIAIEGTTRLWKSSAKKKALEVAERVADDSHPRVYEAGQAAAERLGIACPPLYLVPTLDGGARALGTDDDTVVLLSRDIVASLSDPELVATIGHELGHVQNNHVVYATALYYLQNDALFFVRWVVAPAILALQAWARRAEITCDRAALLCSRSLEATVSALLKEAGPPLSEIPVDTFLADLPAGSEGGGSYGDLFRSHPRLSTRARALREFSKSKYFRKVVGDKDPTAPSSDQVDASVAELLSIF